MQKFVKTKRVHTIFKLIHFFQLVMNAKEEIRQAYQGYYEGKFGTLKD